MAATSAIRIVAALVAEPEQASHTNPLQPPQPNGALKWLQLRREVFPSMTPVCNRRNQCNYTDTPTLRYRIEDLPFQQDSSQCTHDC